MEDMDGFYYFYANDRVYCQLCVKIFLNRRDYQVANNIEPLDAGYAIFPQVNQRLSGRIQV